MSATDDWSGEINEKDCPVLVIIEGLTMYLEESDIKKIFSVINSTFEKATVFVETMNPMIVKNFREKSIEKSNAKFKWGIKSGKMLAELIPDFRFVEDRSLTEGMAKFVPVCKVLGKIPFIRNISNKITVLEKR